MICPAGKDSKTNTFDIITLGERWPKRSLHSGNEYVLKTKSGLGFVLGGKKTADKVPV